MWAGKGTSGRALKRTRLAAAVAMCMGATVDAATIAVTSSSEGSVVGQCTLQDAVQALNSQAVVNACAAGDGNNDLIDLTGFVAPTTITFTSAPDGNSALALSKKVSLSGNLDGSTPLVTIARSSSGETPDFRLIYAGSDVSIHNLALLGGSAAGNGGAIKANISSSISVTNSVVSGNKATGRGGGIYAVVGNYLTLTNTTVSGNVAGSDGGGIYAVASSHFTVSNSIISGNSATGRGGGIATNNGDVKLSDATVTGNTAGGKGGGVYSVPGHVMAYYSRLSANTAGDAGGAIATENGTITLGHSSVSGNVTSGAGGGVRTNAGEIDISYSTLNGNVAGTSGGAIYAGPAQTTTLTNSTVSGNSATSSGGGIFAFSPNLTFATVYANRVTGPAGKGAGVYFTNGATAYASIITGNGSADVDASSSLTLGGQYNIIGASGVAVPADTQNCDVKLGPLANFGGWTKVLPLRAGSCAIDAVPFTSTPLLTMDQRGNARPVQSTAATAQADIGAFEKQSATDPDFIFIDGFGMPASE